MKQKEAYNTIFKGATHRYICNCGEIFSSKDVRVARHKYKEHKKTCKA